MSGVQYATWHWEWMLVKGHNPVSVDGKSDNNDICQMFSDKYYKLYHMMLIYFRRLRIKLIKGYWIKIVVIVM